MLVERINPCIFGSVSPILEGNLPTSELFAMPRNVKEDMLKRDAGTTPDKLFTLRVRSFSVGI
jgi:hypothetical protein